MSYYAMYNALTALLFKSGIKCENHTGSILLLKKFMNELKLFDTILFAKRERIDKQYYVSSKAQDNLTKADAKELVNSAEDIVIKFKLKIKTLKTEDINRIRKEFEQI